MIFEVFSLIALVSLVLVYIGHRNRNNIAGMSGYILIFLLGVTMVNGEMTYRSSDEKNSSYEYLLIDVCTNNGDCSFANLNVTNLTVTHLVYANTTSYNVIGDINLTGTLNGNWNGSGAYVKKSGDTMTGGLFISTTSANALLVQSPDPTDIFIVNTVLPQISAYADIVVDAEVYANAFNGLHKGAWNGSSAYLLLTDQRFNDTALINANNASMKAYVDLQNQTLNTSLISYVNAQNTSMKNYADATFIKNNTQGGYKANLVDINNTGNTTLDLLQPYINIKKDLNIKTSDATGAFIYFRNSTGASQLEILYQPLGNAIISRTPVVYYQNYNGNTIFQTNGNMTFVAQGTNTNLNFQYIYPGGDNFPNYITVASPFYFGHDYIPYSYGNQFAIDWILNGTRSKGNFAAYTGNFTIGNNDIIDMFKLTHDERILLNTNTSIDGMLKLSAIIPPACSTINNGSIVRNATSNKLQYCDGLIWNDLY